MTAQNKTSKVALVTGGSSGMGKDFAKALLKEGYVVYTVARRLEQMDDLKKLGAYTLKMDVTREEDVRQVVDTIKAQHGHVDVLINNAGFGLYGAMEDITIDEARYQFEVNIFGLATITQMLLPGMREQRSGKIINISSVGGKVYTPLGSWYHATKHALEGWSDSLRLELKQFNIDVVVIEPGAIKTGFGDIMIKPMVKRSGNGPYGQIANGLAKSTMDIYAKNQASEPEVITDLIVKAVRAKKPKTRYVAGAFAKPMIFIRKWFGDRVFDRVVMASLGK